VKIEIGLEVTLSQFNHMGILQSNDNQPINLFENQITRCIICHSEIIFLEILSMCTRCMKGLIALEEKLSFTTCFLQLQVFYATKKSNLQTCASTLTSIVSCNNLVY